MTFKKHTTVFFFGVLAVLFTGTLFVASPVFAAELSLNPPSGTYTAGDTVELGVFVDTAGKTINAVSAEIRYDPQILTPEAVAFDASVVDLWLEEPAVIPSQRTVSFEGLILNPGFSGVGRIATLRFRVHTAGDTHVSFASGLVLENDGQGTNVLDAVSDSRIAVAPLSDGRNREERQPLSTVAVGDDGDGEEVLAPVVIDYTSSPKTLNDLVIRGVSYPNARINVFVRLADGTIERFETHSDAGGNFAYRYGSATGTTSLTEASALSILTALPQRQEPVQFWLTATRDTVESDATQSFDATVGSKGNTIVVLSLASLAVVLLVVLVILAIRIVKAVRPNRLDKPPSSPGAVDEEVLTELKKGVDDLAYDVEKYSMKNRQEKNIDT